MSTSAAPGTVTIPRLEELTAVPSSSSADSVPDASVTGGLPRFPAPRLRKGRVISGDTRETHEAKRQKKKKSKREEIPEHIPGYLKKSFMNGPKCTDCKDGGNIIEDHRAGRVVCANCGLVLENDFFDEGSEWRTFADSDKSGPDMNRVGTQQHYLLDDFDNLETSIQGSDQLSKLQMETTAHSGSKRVREALGIIQRKCAADGGLNLGKDVQNFAGELYKSLTELREFKGKKKVPMVATCVYMGAKACRQDRPLKELCEVFGLTRKDVKNIFSEIKRQQADGVVTLPKVSRALPSESTAEVFVIRFCRELRNIPIKMQPKIQEVVRNLEKLQLLSGKQPATISAVAIHLSCVVSDDAAMRSVSLAEIASAARMAEQTILSAFRRFVYARRKEVLPAGFGDPVRIESLSM